MTRRTARNTKPGAKPRAKTGADNGVDIRGIIFDCDGVLFDSKDANTAYYNHIRLAVHLPPINEEEAAFSHMVSADEAIERLIPRELLTEAFEARDRARNFGKFITMMQPAPHVFTFLDSLKLRGLSLALCTNRSDSVHNVLENFGMETYFSPVMTISHARPKPAPEGLFEILKAWNAPPESVIFLGDSLVDQQAAASAGVPFWSFNSPELTAQMHVSSFKELDDIIRLMLMR